MTEHKPPSLKFEPQIDAKVEAHTQTDSPSNSYTALPCALEALCAGPQPSSRKTFTEATRSHPTPIKARTTNAFGGEICGFVYYSDEYKAKRWENRGFNGFKPTFKYPRRNRVQPHRAQRGVPERAPIASHRDVSGR